MTFQAIFDEIVIKEFFAVTQKSLTAESFGEFLKSKPSQSKTYL